MIKSISIMNFKSYQDARLPLSSLSFLIGPNASGKSNALEAIRMLHWLAKGIRLDDLQRKLAEGHSDIRGQPADLFGNDQERLVLGCEVQGDAFSDWENLRIETILFSDQLRIAGESITRSTDRLPLYKAEEQSDPHTDEIRVMYNDFKKRSDKPHIPCSNQQAIFYQLETPSRFDHLHTQSQRIIPASTKVFRENLRNIIFLDPRPALMRGYANAKDDEIREDGSNLSGILYRICAQDEAQKKGILDFIRSLPEQDISDIDFIKTERNDVMVRLVETFGNRKRKIDAPLLSDGTLRILAIAATVFSVPKGALVIMEEIDTGVHPSRSDMLVRNIRNVATHRNLHVLITSHNPALVDALPDESLGDVLCCYRDPETGHSRITRLADLNRFPELVAQGTLGQLMTKRVLDAFLKDRGTTEERKRAALAWVEALEKTEEVR